MLKMRGMITGVCTLGLALTLVGCQGTGESSGQTQHRPELRNAFVFVPAGKTAEQVPVVEPAPAPAPAPVVAPAPAVPALPGVVKSAFAIPTGKKDTSVVLVERMMPAEVAVGQMFDSQVVVTNLTSLVLQDVVVSDVLDSDFKLAGAEPAASEMGPPAKWNLGTFGPGESKTITVKGSAVAAGEIKNCLTVSYVEKACVATNVIEPQLALDIEAPAEVLKCETIPVTYTVVNKGTGVARNVVISHVLPQGLVTESGLGMVEAKVDALEPNMPKVFTSAVKAKAAGTFVNVAAAKADGELKSEDKATTVVRQPVLAITKTGPASIFAGRNATFEITLTNTGDGDAREAVLTDVIPAGARLVSASGATVEGNVVSWTLGTIKPGQTIKGSVVLTGEVIGEVKNVAMAKAFCADDVSASATVAVKGIPAVLLEVIDESDPIVVGDTETYTIVVTNQGSATDTNVKITVELEDAMEFVSAGGATAGMADGKTVTFAPLASLEAKAKATWQVKVKAAKEGDVRFKTSLTTDQLTRPVQETEATNFYK